MSKSKYKNDFPKIVEKLRTEKGLTEKEIAKSINVSVQTLEEYKKKYPKFLEAIKKGKEFSIREVENKLFERCMGSKRIEQKAFKCKDVTFDNGKRIEKERIEVVDIQIEDSPSDTAIIFYLCNMAPDKWRSINKDKVQRDDNWTTKLQITGLDGSAI